MTDITVERYGKTFEFPEGTPSDVQERRIRSWMEKNAPDDLRGGESGAGEPKAPAGGTPALDLSFEKIAPHLMTLSLMGMPPLAALSATSSARRRTSDPNFYRTVAQGALPASDEAIAGIRSLLGESYDTALGEERQGLKDYREKVGPGEAMLTEVAGAVPASIGAAGAAARIASLLGRAAPATARIAQWAARHPWLTAAGTGAATGAATGFAAGEGGTEPRLENAAQMALIGAPLGVAAKGAVEAGRWGWDKLHGPNALAAYLRGRIPQELGDDLAGTPGVRRLPSGQADPLAPDFGANTERVMNRELRRLRSESTMPMPADLMPGTMEAVLQRPGPETAELAKRVGQRQYDYRMARNNPDLADAMSQRSRVGDWFDYLFGQDKFKLDEKALIDQLQQTGRSAYQSAYGQMVNSPRLERAMDNPYVQQAWAHAAKLAEADGRRIGVPIRGGNGAVGQYDVQFLHDLKTTMDDMVRGDSREFADKFLNPRTGRLNKEGFRLNQALRELNNSVKELSPEYATAAQRYASDAEVVGALKRGHEDFFGTPERGGMGIPEIRRFFNDPNIRDEVKDAMRIGAARAARSRLLEGEGKGYTHNWSDFINKPEFVDRLKAISQPHLWDKAFNALRSEAKNYAQVAKATQNSRTAARLQMSEELDSADPIKQLALAAGNPKSPGMLVRAAGAIANHLSPNRLGGDNANKMARLLGAKTPSEQRQATRTIRELLDRSGASSRAFNQAADFAPFGAPYAWTERE